jgi:hypothetical protein
LDRDAWEFAVEIQAPATFRRKKQDQRAKQKEQTMAQPLSLQWNTTYVVQGQPISALVTLYGDGTGTYTLNDGTQGSLVNVAFIPAVNNPGAPFSAGTFTGNWALGGDGGSFFWNVNSVNFTSFTGRWSNNGTGESGDWTGHRAPVPAHP